MFQSLRTLFKLKHVIIMKYGGCERVTYLSSNVRLMERVVALSNKKEKESSLDTVGSCCEAYIIRTWAILNSVRGREILSVGDMEIFNKSFFFFLIRLSFTKVCIDAISSSWV